MNILHRLRDFLNIHARSYPQSVIKELIVKYQETKEIEYKNEVIAANYRFVFNVAKHYHKKTHQDIYDLFVEGNIGVSDAVEIFEVERGHSFLSMAVWHIRKRICRYLEENYSGLVKMGWTDVKNHREARKTDSTLQNLSYHSSNVNSDGSLEDVFETIAQETFNIHSVEKQDFIKTVHRKISEVLIYQSDRDRDMFYTYTKGYSTLSNLAIKYGISKQCMQQSYTSLLNKIKSNMSEELKETYQEC